MDLLQAIVLGIVKGLTEFLPISRRRTCASSRAFFGWRRPGRGLHGRDPARHDRRGARCTSGATSWRIVSTWVARSYRPELRGTLDARMGWYVVYGTIPIAVLGLVFKDQIETGARATCGSSAAVLILCGVVLWLVDKRVRAATHDRRPQRCATASSSAWRSRLALVPGVSRSGATITAGLRPGLHPRGRRAVLLPAVRCPRWCSPGCSSCARSAATAAPGGGRPSSPTLVAFVVGYAAIAWLLRWLAGHSMLVFAVYRVALGALILVLVYGGHLAAT